MLITAMRQESGCKVKIIDNKSSIVNSSPSRRQFLQKISGWLLASLAGIPLLPACGAAMVTYRGKIDNNAIRIPKSRVEALSHPHGIVLITAPGLKGGIIVRNVNGVGLVALSALCTHRGCEVRAFPGSLQCPCHGSEYDEYGEVLEGPAREALHRYDIRDTGDGYLIGI